MDEENMNTEQRKQKEEKEKRAERIKRFLRLKFLARIVNVSEFMISFKKIVFIKFFIYHLLFFYFGFLSLAVIVPIDNLALANNMSFWVTTKNKLHLYVQSYQWLVNLMVVLFALEK